MLVNSTSMHVVLSTHVRTQASVYAAKKALCSKLAAVNYFPCGRLHFICELVVVLACACNGLCQGFVFHSP